MSQSHQNQPRSKKVPKPNHGSPHSPQKPAHESLQSHQNPSREPSRPQKSSRPSPNTSRKNLTINEKIDRLHEMSEWFYGDEFNLDQASEKYKAAVKLSYDIENDLQKLKNKIETIDRDFTVQDDFDDPDFTIPF